MGAIASLITNLTTVYSIVYSGTDQRKYQSSASLAFVRGIHRGLVNSPHKWPVARKMFPFDDVIMSVKYRYHRLEFSRSYIFPLCGEGSGFVNIYWGLNKMADILQRYFQMLFLGRKLVYFDSTWSFFPKVLLLIGSGNGLVPKMPQATTWTNDGPVLRHL